VIAPVERLRLSPAGDKLAATTGIGQRYVSQVNATDGKLSATKETIVSDGANLEEVIFDPSGRNIYTADQDNGGLFEFAVGADGSTTPLPGSALPTRMLLTGMAISSAGDRLYAVTAINSEIATFLRDTTTGSLTPTTDVVNTGGFLPGRIVRVPALNRQRRPAQMIVVRALEHVSHLQDRFFLPRLPDDLKTDRQARGSEPARN
jgi:6-phosphogluconolactonase (cycloisomerase 2 family)